MKDVDTLKVKMEPRTGRIYIKEALRKHTGIYKLTVTNSSGSDEADVELVVLGKPASPGGPLQVSDVTKDSAKLKWTPPTDTGGHDIR